MANQTEITGVKATTPHPTRYTAADCTRATRRCAELQADNPKWPQARVRKAVGREMGVSNTVLRYLLRKLGE